MNVFPTLGGETTNTSFSAPLALNVLRGRTIHNIRVTASHTSTAAARTAFPASRTWPDWPASPASRPNPFDWGVPALSFAGISSLRDITPTRRTDTRVQTDYTFTRPLEQHTLRFGGGFRHDVSDGWTVSEARGSFVFTGLYSADGGSSPGSGLDFADFLLGLPQQASVGYGPGDVELRGRSFSLFAQDDWRARSNLTFNLGLRYELSGRSSKRTASMANLDVAPGLHRRRRRSWPAAPARSPARSRSALVNPTPTTWRRGSAWRGGPRRARSCAAATASASTTAPTPRSRGSWSAQPPFAVTNTSIGTDPTPLNCETALAGAAGDDHQQLRRGPRLRSSGAIQTWNIDCHATSARCGPPAPATPTRAARAWTSCARPTAAPTACASRACSRSSGRRRRARRSALGHAPAAAPAGARHRRRRHLHAGPVAATTRRRSAAAATVVAQNDQDLDGRVGAVELRPAASVSSRT